MSLSHQEKREFTIFGYIRSNYKPDVTDDIKRLCLAFYTTIEIGWDVICDELKKFVSDNELEINIPNYTPCPGYRTFASSTGWNEGIHSYTLEITPRSSSLSVGIISSEEIPNIESDEFGTNFYIHPQHSEAVGYCLDNLCTMEEIKNGTSVSMVGKGAPRKWRSEVTIVVDCDNWKLKYYLDGQNDLMDSGTIDIIENKTYHPIFSEWSVAERSYKLAETTIGVTE